MCVIMTSNRKILNQNAYCRNQYFNLYLFSLVYKYRHPTKGLFHSTSYNTNAQNSSTPLYNASNKHFSSFLKSLNIFLGYFNSCPENYLTQFRLVNKLANHVVRKGRFIRLSDNRINMDYCLVWYSLISLTRTVILCHQLLHLFVVEFSNLVQIF